jgi:hypothetical protein
MHAQFADWYRLCTTGTDVKLTGDLLALRWKGVEKIIANVDGNELELVRLLLQRQPKDGGYLSQFRAAFKETDSTFQMSGNNLEISLLAGAVLGQLFTNPSPVADSGALGLLCSTQFSDELPTWAQQFVAAADSYLDERLGNRRRPSEVKTPQIEAKKFKAIFDPLAAKLAANEHGAASEALKQLAESLTQSLTSSLRTMTAAFRELETQSNLRREETDVLWWMTAGVSRDLGEEFSDMKPHVAALVAGRELGELVSAPGILPAKSILQRVIPRATGKADTKPVSLAAAVNATATTWRGEFIEAISAEKVVDLCPVLSAIQHSFKATDLRAWAAPFKKLTGVDAAVAHTPVELAHQLYRECLLARLGAEDEA